MCGAQFSSETLEQAAIKETEVALGTGVMFLTAVAPGVLSGLFGCYLGGGFEEISVKSCVLTGIFGLGGGLLGAWLFRKLIWALR